MWSRIPLSTRIGLIMIWTGVPLYIMASLTPVIPLNMAEFLGLYLVIIGFILLFYGVVKGVKR
jgi:hypothetical protein